MHTHVSATHSRCAVSQSAANAMKHSVATQGSNVYDAKTHDRLNKAAFDWCASFAAKFEANHDDDEEQEEQEQEQE